jgi:hypothetical protein
MRQQQQEELDKYSPESLRKFFETYGDFYLEKSQQMPRISDEKILNMYKANFTVKQQKKRLANPLDSDTEEDTPTTLTTTTTTTTTSTDLNLKKFHQSRLKEKVVEDEGSLVVGEQKTMSQDQIVISGPNERKLKVHLTIDIGQGKSEEILIYEGDECSDVARSFCKRNSLKMEYVPIISEHIQQQLNEFERKTNKRRKKKHVSGNSEMNSLNPDTKLKPEAVSLTERKEKKHSEHYNDEAMRSRSKSKNASTLEKNSRNTMLHNDVEVPHNFNGTSSTTKKKNIHWKSSSSEHSEEEEGKVLSARYRNADKKTQVHNEYNSKLEKSEKKVVIKSEKKEREKTPDLTKRRESLRDRSNDAEFAKKTKRELAQVQAKDQELKNCTFKPNINKKKTEEILSKQLNKSASSTNIYEKLYYDHVLSKDKRKIIEKEYLNDTCPFQPFKKTPKKRNEKKLLNKSERDTENKSEWYERLYELPRKEKDNIPKELRDPVSGQPYFQPKISKDPHFKKARIQEELEDEIKIIDPDFYEVNGIEKKISAIKDRSNLPVFKSAGINSLRAKTPVKGEEKKFVFESPEKSYAESEREAKEYIKEEDIKVLLVLFQLMDSDRDNKLSKTKVDFSQLDTNLLEIVADIILELFEQKPRVDFNDFCFFLKEKNHLEGILKVNFLLYI